VVPLVNFSFLLCGVCARRTVAVGNVLELSNRRGDLQTEVEDLLLALETDVCGPSDHAAEVALGLDVLADAIVLGALLNERVLAALERAIVRKADGYVPWGPSCYHRPCPGGRGQAPLSFL
jgi:hypothetical protein